jgi:nucleoside-diphosphate-sugar epimerase
MKIFVAGGTGAIGRPLVKKLIDDKNLVIGLARSDRAARQLETLGAQVIKGDALDGHSLSESLAATRPDVVVNQLTALPKRIQPRQLGSDLATTNRLRTEAIEPIVAAARAIGATLIVHSTAFAYSPKTAELCVEEDPLFRDAPGEWGTVVRAIHHMESRALSIPDSLVLRYGHLYGPGTSYAADGSLTNDVRLRRIPLIGPASGEFSFIHVADAVEATLASLKRKLSGIYNVVDDEPAPVYEWLPFLAAQLGAPKPKHVPKLAGRLAAGWYGTYAMTAQSGASNRKLKDQSGWAPRIPSWRTGFVDLRNSNGDVAIAAAASSLPQQARERR